ncbi:MAG TPA: helix-turn-helix transcriptional regulator [Pseudonocardia sp.]|uniref:helix-turn-helix transcriptional regulator n=1 Tax=Pseudonocardia sp. TaxID=60912 RepID=UPI002BA8D3BD|nr:helix-turn-helix transcriptional regulator [Pseudonocardia sp.]HTF48816.1 helix-turn-helix transcriptional regulator [Pseudonocardia sp.]
MGTRSHSPEELGAFLKARRGDIDPAAVGLVVGGGPRRVPGLRREEVAQLAMISTDYYTRLEQGRLAGASPTVLDAMATALRLGPDERSYLYQLANKSDRQQPRKPRVERVLPQTQQLLDNLRDSPALVLGRYLDIVAWNRLATAVFTDFSAIPRRERNFLRMLFLDPTVRGRYLDWSSIARICVGYVRAAAEGQGEVALSELIGDLSLRDPDFRTWWAERHANYQSHGTKTLIHPRIGEYTLDWQTLHTPDNHQTLMVMTAPAGSRGLEVLRQLDACAEASTVVSGDGRYSDHRHSRPIRPGVR